MPVPDRLDLFVTKWKSTLHLAEKLLHDPRAHPVRPRYHCRAAQRSRDLALFHELQSRKMPVSELVVNQLHMECDCPTCKDAASDEQFQIQRLMTGIVLPCPVWGIGLQQEEVRGQQLLMQFWDHAQPIARRPEIAVGCSIVRRPAALVEPAVLVPAPAPSARMQFMLFAGKGGVGKTTLSCVTAVRMARDFPDKRVVPRHNSIRGQNGSDE